MKYFNLFLTSLLLLLTGCNNANLDTLSYDRLEPASLSFADNVRTIAVINLAPASALGMPIVAENLAQQIADAEYFDSVILCDTSVENSIKQFCNVPMTKNDIDSILSLVGTDAACCLCYGDVNTQPNLPQYSVKVLMPIIVYGKSRAYAMVADSTTWNSESEAFVAPSIIAADCLVKHVVPTWKTIDMGMYSNVNFLFRDAAVLYGNGNFEKAEGIWKGIYAEKSPKKSAYAAYNLMQCYERQDMIDSAFVWLEKAETAFSPFNPMMTKALNLHKARLENRTLDIQKLNIQMARFKEEEKQ